VNFDFLSPYTISKALKGIEILKELLANMESDTAFVWYQNCKIKRSALRKGIDLYGMAVDSFIAQNIINIEKENTDNQGYGEWVDLAGMLAPLSMIEDLCKNIVSEKPDLAVIQQKIMDIYYRYQSLKISYAKSLVELSTQKEFGQLTGAELDEMIQKGEKAERNFNDLILRDARKEFSSTARIGFGIDGNEDIRNADFELTRGVFENHPFVIERKRN
jgi:hypothetical protein